MLDDRKLANSKNLNFFKTIKIEEYVLIGFSLVFFSLTSFSDFSNGWILLKSSANWWLGGPFILLLIYLVFQLYAFLIKLASKKTIRLAREFHLKYVWFLVRLFGIILIASSVMLFAAGFLYDKAKDRLMNLQLLKIDKFLTGDYPFLWLQSYSNPLKGLFDALTPIILPSFLSLGLVMGALALIFYLDKNQYLFKGYILALFIVVVLAIPFWYFFPANSPANAFLYNPDFSQMTKNYQPNAQVKSFQEKIWEEQKSAMPVTTMPSMHWAWTSIVVYYLFKKTKKTICFSSAWLILTLLGSIYLGCHYLIDGIVALPLAVLSIFLANFFVGLEKKYYQENYQEMKFKKNVKEGLLGPFQEIKCQIFNKVS